MFKPAKRENKKDPTFFHFSGRVVTLSFLRFNRHLDNKKHEFIGWQMVQVQLIILKLNNKESSANII